MKVKVVESLEFGGEKYEVGEVVDMPQAEARRCVANSLVEWEEEMVLVTNEMEEEMMYEKVKPGDPMWVSPSFAKTFLEDGSVALVRDLDGYLVTNKTHDLLEALDFIHIRDGVTPEAVLKKEVCPTGERAQLAAVSLEVGDKVRITEGPLEGQEARIIDLDEYRGRVTLDIDPIAISNADKLKLIEKGGSGPVKAPAWRDIRRIPDRIPIKYLKGCKEGDEVELPEEAAREAIEKGWAEVRGDFGDLVRGAVFPSGHVERGRWGKVLVKKGPDQAQLRYRDRNHGADASAWIPMDEARELEKEEKVEIVREWGEVEHYFHKIANLTRTNEIIPNEVSRKDITPRTPPAQMYYVLSRLYEKRQRDRAEPVGNPKKWGDWMKRSRDSIEEVLGQDLDTTMEEELPYIDQLMVSLSKWNEFRRSPRFLGERPVPAVLKNPTETRKLAAAREALKREYKVRPIDLRLLTVMDTAYAPDPKDNKGVSLDGFKEFFEERLEIRMPRDWPKHLLDPLKKLCRRKPKHKRLAHLRWVSDDEKYNVLTKRGSFFLWATFPPWDKAGFVHRRKTKDAKFCVEQMGCYGYPVFHGEGEVEFSRNEKTETQSSHAPYIPRSYEPDMIIFYPESQAKYFDQKRAGGTTEWSEDVLHGEIIRNVIQTPKMVKSALRKNTGLGRRTVFFVSSRKEALKVREKALEFLESKGLPEVITVGMEQIPVDCLVVIQPVKSHAPTKSGKREMKEEETIKKVGEALVSGGKVRKHRRGNKVYVEIKKPGESRFHGEGHVSEKTWSEIEEWRDSPFLDQYPPSRVERIKGDWRSRMKKAIETELGKRKERRIVEINQTKIRIGQFEFKKTDESESYLRRLMKGEA